MGCNCNKSETFSFNDEIVISSGIVSIEKKIDTIFSPTLDKEEQDKRLNICKACEFYKIVMNKEKCTCGTSVFLRAKISLTDQFCPDKIRKW